MKGRYAIIVASLLGILLWIACSIPQSWDRMLMWKYDLLHENNTVTSETEVTRILQPFHKLGINDLDPHYLGWTKSSEEKYLKTLKGSRFTVIQRDDFYKKVAGDFRIRDFVCRDSLYSSCLYNPRQDYYWLINEDLLYAVVHLRKSLKEKGFNPDGFWIRSGHRHPRKNLEVKGAGLSRHMNGEAVDIVIMDINDDGIFTQEDKQIVLEIAEKEIIKNRGGIGRYPGTKTIHIDVRGYRARWDSY